MARLNSKRFTRNVKRRPKLDPEEFGVSTGPNIIGSLAGRYRRGLYLMMVNSFGTYPARRERQIATDLDFSSTAWEGEDQRGNIVYPKPWRP